MPSIFKGEIVNSINNLKEVKWVYRSSHSDGGRTIKDSAIFLVPVIAFRLFDEDEYFIDNLKSLIDNFEGKASWSLAEDLVKPNLPIISVKAFLEFSRVRLESPLNDDLRSAFSSDNQEIARFAYEDIKGLAKEIRNM